MSVFRDRALRTATFGSTDAELIDASLVRPSVFGDLLLRHYTSVFAFVARRLGREPADRLAPEVFSTAFGQRLHAKARDGSALLWLYGVAQRIVDDSLESSGGVGGIYLHGCLTNGEGDWPDAVHSRVNEALSRISKQDRDVLLLNSLEELDLPDIGRVLGLDVVEVRRRLARARRQFLEVIPDCAELTALV